MKVFRTQFADVQKTNSIFSALKNVKQKDLLLRKHGLFTFLNKGFLNSGGGPTPFLYMATRFLPNVHVQNVQKCTKMYKIGFFMFGSSLDRFTCCG